MCYLTRIEKLHNSKSVEITGKEITPSDDLKQYKKNALEYGKSLRGEYTNGDTGICILLSAGTRNGGIREILQHDYKDLEHHYDHKLTQTEKEKLLDEVARVTSPPCQKGVFKNSPESSRRIPNQPLLSDELFSDYKDKRLISILQINSSKSSI